MTLQTELEFQLPKGYVDEEGNLHRKGVMRLATAADEILPMRDSRVQANAAYLTVIVLSRVITRLGDLRAVTPKVVEGLFSGDLAYLQEFYRRINEEGAPRVHAKCPSCQTEFDVDLLGGEGRSSGQGGS